MTRADKIRKLASKADMKRAERDRAPYRSNRRTILDKDLQRLITERIKIETRYLRSRENDPV